ncbi:MAG: hypothetical protein IJL27_07230, partial [Firmicutes bacterium]|nr:hypothetical protein [Bacillota bacterium]
LHQPRPDRQHGPGPAPGVLRGVAVSLKKDDPALPSWRSRIFFISLNFSERAVDVDHLEIDHFDLIVLYEFHYFFNGLEHKFTSAGNETLCVRE